MCRRHLSSDVKNTLWTEHGKAQIVSDKKKRLKATREKRPNYPEGDIRLTEAYFQPQLWAEDSVVASLAC